MIVLPRNKSIEKYLTIFLSYVTKYIIRRAEHVHVIRYQRR